MHRIGIVGAGHIGLVTAACLADLGNSVICVDDDRNKIAKLKKGISPIYEPGLDKLLKKNMRAKRLVFGHSIQDATRRSEIIFICVGTPAEADGSADLSAVAEVSSEIAKAMNGYKLIVGKSTVPAQTGQRIKDTMAAIVGERVPFDIVSNPEFLREGRAIGDTLHPDRIVLGVESRRAERIMRDLYKPIEAPILMTNIATAELIKHASNSFLSTKISFINAISVICDHVGADIELVAEGMGLDSRIGRPFLQAGLGFGGYCLPKDIDALIAFAAEKGYDFELLKAVKRINVQQRFLIFAKIQDVLGTLRDRTIGVLGLSFKPETDDIRNSISIEIIRMLQAEGAHIKVYDPKAMAKARSVLRDVVFCRNPYAAARGSDCILLATEWGEFRRMDLKKLKKIMKQPVLIDGRNVFDPETMNKTGFVYRCIGRPQDA